MKKNFVIFTTILAACITGISASAQGKLKMELGYNISSPIGSFKNDYVNTTSFRGAIGELSYAVNPKFSVGLQSGYQNYYQKYDRSTYKLENGQTLSAVITNSMDITPLILKGTFYPVGSNVTAKVQPYVSAGAGINLVSYGQYLGQFGGTEASTPFAAQVGAGLQILFGKSINQTGIKLGATYNYSSYNRNQITQLNNIGAHVGVIFGLR